MECGKATGVKLYMCNALTLSRVKILISCWMKRKLTLPNCDIEHVSQ